MKGRIFNIEEFAVHDGPGIRKLVFLKGCPLKCTWCHNPEGISFKKEMMISRQSCIDCGRCREVCDHDECIVCSKCSLVCPLQLRKICGEDYEAADLAKKLLKGKEVLVNSGGGITFSGGEPLAQPEFLFEMIRKLKPVHIAVETSGYANSSVFRKMVELADLVLMDIKHTDNDIHKKFTGVSNYWIFKNLKYLCNTTTPFHIRIPLIPGVNDTKENMERIAELLKDAKNLLMVEILPYHQTAPAKYAMIGKKFEPGFDVERKLNVYPEVFRKLNIKTNIL
jgi:pyruvate formate lyase activating enzyme